MDPLRNVFRLATMLNGEATIFDDLFLQVVAMQLPVCFNTCFNTWHFHSLLFFLFHGPQLMALRLKSWKKSRPRRDGGDLAEKDAVVLFVALCFV